MRNKYLIIDRDGTIINEPVTDKQVDSLEKLVFLKQSISTLKYLSQHFELIMFTNQDGLGTDSFPTEDFEVPQNKMIEILESENIVFKTVLICPHKPEDQCECRKPSAKLLVDYLFENDLMMDKQNSFVIGDRDSDRLLAENCGIGFIQMNQDDPTAWQKAKAAAMQSRNASQSRKTNETEISVSINLDGSGIANMNTGLPFFDHMLAQLARFSNIDMTISAKGDLEVDAHHMVEDVGILLGQCMLQAVGNKFGIERYAFLLPMDETQCQVALDFSGRFHYSFEGEFSREVIGDLPTEMVKHFFYSLSEQLKLTCHIKVVGENDHHKIESIFKCVGNCFKDALTISSEKMMSTKGVL